MNDLRTDDNKEAFTQCIAFESSFCSLKKGGGTWEANEEYTWSWWLARSEQSVLFFVPIQMMILPVILLCMAMNNYLLPSTNYTCRQKKN